ncbi:Phosphorelay intermediate protein [Cryptotrichosporon argae]
MASSAPKALPSEKAKAEQAKQKLEIPTDPEGIIDMETFNQIREMDDEDDEDGGGNEFSKSIVEGYFEQAETTFKSMEDAFAARDLTKLGALGHFLKGSSAALGIVKVQATCERMQHYGHCRDEEVGADLSEDDALARIERLLVDCKRDYRVAHGWLRRLYGDAADDGDGEGEGEGDDAALDEKEGAKVKVGEGEDAKAKEDK